MIIVKFAQGKSRKELKLAIFQIVKRYKSKKGSDSRPKFELFASFGSEYYVHV